MPSPSMEEVVEFSTGAHKLFGILHSSLENQKVTACLIMVIGGPQTRVGCHRAYVHLARALCEKGITVLRFDYAGLGDAEGSFVGYEFAAPSIQAALEFSHSHFPNLKKTILWSLCDGSAACSIFAPWVREKLSGMILCNPFVLSDQGKARTYLRHYYLKRLFDTDLWLSILTLKFNPFKALGGLSELMQKAIKKGPGGIATPGSQVKENDSLPKGCFREAQVREEVIKSIVKFEKPITFLLSTEDMTALEFEGLVNTEKSVNKLLRAGKIKIRKILGADHTFSKVEFRSQVVTETIQAFESM